jgi:soluble lytic murein transglycosylase-like protein
MPLAELLCLAMLSLNVGDTPDRSRFACTLSETIVQESNNNGLRPELVASIIHYESRYSPTARSNAPACGLMQIMPKYTGSRQTGVPSLTCNQLFDPFVNIRAGTKTFRYWYRAYGRGSERIGLCGYYAGFRCRGSNPLRSGMRYATRILRLAELLRVEMDNIQRRSAQD